MGHTRHFLGWTRPVTSLVADHLLPENPITPVDLEDTLVVVPTRQAGRRLRETMARRCADFGTTLLSARVVTPHFFLQPRGNSAPEASSTLVLSAWVDVLQSIDLSEFPALFPSAVVQSDFGWAVSQAELIDGLRGVVVDGGWSLEGVVGRFGDELEELDRWRELAELEQRYESRLKSHGFSDPWRRRLDVSESPPLPEGVSRIVVAAVPDPSLLALRAMKRIAADRPVVVLVHAPGSLGAGFDEWGRPNPAFWRSRSVDIPEADRTVLSVASPDAQARALMNILAKNANQFGPLDVAIGVPDRGVVSHIETRLEEKGVTAREPADRSVSDHPLYQLVSALVDVSLSGSYRAVADLLRQPDVLYYLEKVVLESDASSGEAGAVLSELDRFQNQFLPVGLDDFRRLFGDDRVTERFPSLAAALNEVFRWLGLFEQSSPEESLRSFLIDVYGVRSVSSLDSNDRELEEVAQAVSTALAECSDLDRTVRRPTGEMLRLLLRRLKQERYSPSGAEPLIDLEGWLELPWNDAPLMIVTGMNEGAVPDSRMSDVFLPDSLRRLLGLRDDPSRFARDLYLMESLIECRRGGGRCYFVSGQISTAGDPLKPSRLLFRCPDDQLADRARALFAPANEGRRTVAATVGFQLDPWNGYEPIRRLSVTALGGYLACPFRFYLRNVLGMEALSDDKSELDSLDFGTIVHAALESLGRRRELRESEDDKELGDYLCAEVESIIRKRHGDRPTLAVWVALDSARQRLRAAALHLAQLNREGWRTIAIEKRGELTLGGVQLRGKIDRVDYHEESGRWRVIDYKSSDRPTSPHKAHVAKARDGDADFTTFETDDKRLVWRDLQLPVYLEMLPLLDGVGEIAQCRVELAYFNLPRTVQESGVQVWKEFKPEWRTPAIETAREIVNRIEQGMFWPPAERVKYDDFADVFPLGIGRSVEAPSNPGASP